MPSTAPDELDELDELDFELDELDFELEEDEEAFELVLDEAFEEVVELDFKEDFDEDFEDCEAFELFDEAPSACALFLVFLWEAT